MVNTRARSFIGIIIGIAIFALFFRMAIERVIKISIVQNESNAQVTLKSISAAIENYAKDHLGVFPASISELTQNQPAYLDESYLAQAPLKGYNYDCSRLESTGYTCSASPARCNLSGRIIYTITTGGLLAAEECSRKE